MTVQAIRLVWYALLLFSESCEVQVVYVASQASCLHASEIFVPAYTKQSETNEPPADPWVCTSGHLIRLLPKSVWPGHPPSVRWP